MDHPQRITAAPQYGRGILKRLTGLHPAHSTVALRWQSVCHASSMRCSAEHACWARRRRIFSGYGSLSSSLVHRLSAYSLSWWGKRREHEIALSGEMERAAKRRDKHAVFPSLSSRGTHDSAGVCTLPRDDAGGLPGFFGPFPSATLDESERKIFGCWADCI
jgi:hypothetical protein